MRVIISAGGTGGHIYPALSIIDEILSKNPDSKILYIGTTDRMEKDIVPLHKIDYFGIKVRGFDRKLSLSNIKTINYFLNAVNTCKKKIKEFKPDLVIGVGGYVTAPVVYAANKCGVKTIIHEQNSVLGMTNKFLSKYADAVLISFRDTIVNNKNVIFTGNPCGIVRKIDFDKSELGLSNNKKLVLIVMGSLGSKVVNDKMKDILKSFNDKDYEILFVTGKDYYDEFESLKLSKNIIIKPYIDNIAKLFSKVDVMVSRAGATTISEIIAYKIPTILVPSPYVTDNHQYKNAKSLFDKNAAMLIEENNLNSDILINNIEELLNNKDKINSIRSNLATLNISNGREVIYEVINEIVSGRSI